MFYLTKWRFGRNRARIRHVVTSMIAQARTADLYQQGGIPDTIPGRVESILLHLCLIVHALRDEGSARTFIAELYRVVFRHHLDPAMRELAIGDLSVPKQMRKLAEGIHGRGTAYAEALSAGEAGGAGLEIALARNFSLDSAEWLADYTKKQAAHLAQIGAIGLMRDDWAFAGKEPEHG